MTTLKLITFLTILSLFSCKTNNKQIIAKWDNGKPKVERLYSDTPNCFIEKNYYNNGQLASENKFIDSVQNGESIAYYEDGKILGKCVYRNGKINGEVTEFHKTGNLMFKGHQIDGNLVGIATHYYDNGKPESEYYYRDSNMLLVNYWDSSSVQQIVNGNGIKKFKDTFKKGETVINGFVVGTYKDSLHSGVWRYYNLLDNKLILERTFENDKIVSEEWK